MAAFCTDTRCQVTSPLIKAYSVNDVLHQIFPDGYHAIADTA